MCQLFVSFFGFVQVDMRIVSHEFGSRRRAVNYATKVRLSPEGLGLVYRIAIAQKWQRWNTAARTSKSARCKKLVLTFDVLSGRADKQSSLLRTTS